jgi:predicted nucleotidyltransferase
MKRLNQNFRDLLECLNSAGARYLVLGGYAVNFHGYHRNTKDFDVWIAVDPDNAERVSTALQQFAFPASSVPPSRFLAKGVVHAFGREPLRVDILTNPSGVQFEDCFARRVETTLDGVRVPFISLDDLRTNKRASGRLKDLADVNELSSPPVAKPSASSPPKRKPPRRKRRSWPVS